MAITKITTWELFFALHQGIGDYKSDNMLELGNSNSSKVDLTQSDKVQRLTKNKPGKD